MFRKMLFPSPNGRTLSKMAHSDRISDHVLQNIPGDKDQKIFASGCEVFPMKMMNPQKNRIGALFMVLLSIAIGPAFLNGDECILKPGEKKQVFGDTTIILKVDNSEINHEISVSVFLKEKLKAKFNGILFERLFPSPKNDYFLGVTNTGIPGTAFILFNKYGELLREVKHDFLDFIPYCHESIICDRTWYNEAKPDVEFVFDDGMLSKVLITGCDGKRYNLYDPIIMHKSADGKTQKITLDESGKK